MTATAQLATRVATLTGDQLTMEAAQDLIAQGAKVKARDYLTVNAEGKIVIGAVAETRSTQTLPGTTGYKGKEAYWKQSETTALGSSFEGGNKVDLTSEGKLSLTGSRVSSDLGHVNLQGNSVDILAAVTDSRLQVQSVGASRYLHTDTQAQHILPSRIDADKSIIIEATGEREQGEGHIAIKGSSLDAQAGEINLFSAGDTRIESQSTQSSHHVDQASKSSGWLGLSKTTREGETTVTLR